MMNDKWREACGELQSEGVKFDYLNIEGDWGCRGHYAFMYYDQDKYRIAQQPVPDRPDWRDWCRKLQDEYRVKFELFSDNSQEWREAKCYFNGYDLSHYLIAQQPIPEQIINYLQEEQMNDKIMMDGEPLEVGDPVYCLVNGWLTVASFVYKNQHPVRCADVEGVQYAYTQGFQQEVNTGRILYWDEIKITPPPKPKKKVKVWDWFVQWPNGDVNRMDMLTEQQARDGTVVVQKIDGTEREIEQ